LGKCGFTKETSLTKQLVWLTMITYKVTLSAV
jgi:hypothetical protein